MTDDPLMNPDEKIRQAYIDQVNKTVEEFRQQDAAQRRFWASKQSIGVTTLLGASGFGDGPYAVDSQAQ